MKTYYFRNLLLGAGVLTMLALVLIPMLPMAASCVAFEKVSESIENMPEDKFAYQQARIERITRGLTAVAIMEEFLSPAEATKAAVAIDQAADDLNTAVGPDLLRAILQTAGVTDPKVLLLVDLVADIFPDIFNWGDNQALIGPHARQMLRTVATGIRTGAGGNATPAEVFEAKDACND